ncbi:MAG: PmoA family protein [Pricia sp.]
MYISIDVDDEREEFVGKLMIFLSFSQKLFTFINEPIIFGAMRIRVGILACLLVISCSEKKQVHRFKIPTNNQTFHSQPISVDLNGLTASGVDSTKPYVLMAETGGNRHQVSFQVEEDKNRMWFVPDAEANASYFIENGLPIAEEASLVSEHKKGGDLQLLLDDHPVLSYRYEMTYPPEGVDSIYGKSGYVHPVITPKGDTLTRIQPPDHYHHYGVWGPWTHTQIDSQQVDFWNLGDHKGTVLFKEFEDTDSGKIFASFNAAQEHIDKLTQEEPQTALNENLKVRLWNMDRPDRYMFDYTSTFSSPLEDGILFEAYRYGGGIGMRFTERWKADNCSVLTSEGKDRLEADGTNARWCIVSGASADEKGTSGILFMSHPENRAHPEPMRVWPIDANGGRGDMFFEFCPIRHEEWQIEPNKEYDLKYRMVVFDGELQAEEAEAYWQNFAHPPEITVVEK